MTLKDEEGKVYLLFWGDQTNNYVFHKNQIVIFQNVLIKEFKGFSLTFNKNSKVLENVPDHPRCKELFRWFDFNKFLNT